MFRGAPVVEPFTFEIAAPRSPLTMSSITPLPRVQERLAPSAHPPPCKTATHLPPTLLPRPPNPSTPPHQSASQVMGPDTAAYSQAPFHHQLYLAPSSSPILQPPPTPTVSPMNSQFDPRWQPEFPSTLLYYTADKTSLDTAERYRASSFYWQQAYMKTYSELSHAYEALETRLHEVERRLGLAEFAFIVCLPLD